MIHVTKKDKIATLSFDNGHNKLSFSFTPSLADTLESLDKDPHISVIIVKGGEKAFSVGAALDELAELKETEVDGWLRPWERVAEISKPIIMALDGYVLGGGLEIAMMGDILIATDRTYFGQPEIKLGLIPGCGGTLRLLKCIGYNKSIEMCMRGEFISAPMAYDFGLINHLVTPEQILIKATQVAEAIQKHPAPALIQIKTMMKKLYDTSEADKHHLQEERILFKRLLKTENGKEGLRAFLEKREPTFRHG